MKHKLKTWPHYFEAVVSGEKTFEVRKDDREFKVGDVLELNEWDPKDQKFTGRLVERVVTYKLRANERFGVMEGFCVLGLANT